MTNNEYMTEALKEAKIAYELGEVPVGAIIVCNNEIVGRGHNLRETSKNALTHAEIIAIDSACKKLSGWRLWECDMYVTLEPCPMCAGAIINARIKNIYYGAKDYKNGSCGSIVNLFEMEYNHKPICTSGIMERECSEILTTFFTELRKKKSESK